MEYPSITTIWRFLTWLPKFILRRIFTKDRLAALILIDVRPRYDYCTINLGASSSFDLWLEIRNLSPFSIEIDRAELKFYAGGTTHKAFQLEKETVLPDKVWVWFVQENIGDGQANQIARNIENHQATIEVVMECESVLHRFKCTTGRLEGLRPRFLNQNARGA